jgi:aromatic-L-amino-acid decarboxylase
MTGDEFRRRGHALVDWIADYRQRVEERPVMSRATPGSIREALPPHPPESAEPFDDVMRDLDTIVVPGLSHWTHPRFFGYFPANCDLSTVLADLVSTGLGPLGLSWQAAPALTELEEVTTGWLRQMVGLSDGWTGVIQDTASTSTLVALVCARERASGAGHRQGGLQAEVAPLVVYTSDQSHSSVEKAARLAGFGAGNVRLVAHDVHGSMRTDSLRAAMADDQAAGRVPCAIVATTGTTASTAVDPIDAIAALAGRHGVWLHVDAAMAGSAMILPECRWMWHGVEAADSVVLNPHKWLGAAFDCSVYYVRDPAQLAGVMGTSPSYLQSAADGQVRNLRDWGIPLGRRFRALKLWFLIREHGAEGLRARLRRDMANAAWLERQVRSTPRWRVLNPVILQTVCVRHEPPGVSDEALDRHTLDWVDRVNRSGDVYLTPAVLDGRWMARVSVGGLTTEREHVEHAWAAMRREAER